MRDASDKKSSASSLPIGHLARNVRGRIPKHAEDSLNQVDEALLLVELAFGGARVDGEHGRLSSECAVHQGGAVIQQPGPRV